MKITTLNKVKNADKSKSLFLFETGKYVKVPLLAILFLELTHIKRYALKTLEEQIIRKKLIPILNN